MKGDAKVIEHLNQALTNELTAINQYWLHYRVLADWGVTKLADYERRESIEEMQHADRLAERILFLEGLPNFQAIHRLKVGETVEEICAPTWRWSSRRSRCCARRPITPSRCATTRRSNCSRTFSPTRRSMSTSSKRSST